MYLKSVGLFKTLKEADIEVDDRGVENRPMPQLVLPLTRFTSEPEVENLANHALEALQNSDLGAPNLYQVVSEIFAELALNAVQHAASPVGAFGLIQFYQGEIRRRFVCTVADGGIGIRASLERNPSLRRRVPYDWAAIKLAVKEGVSGTGSERRGIGLYGVAEDMRQADRQLIIHSGIGMLLRTGISDTPANRARVLYPGTLVSASIPT